MKRLIIIALLAMATTASALEKDPKTKEPIQGFAASGLESAALTINSTWYDLSNYEAFSATAPADCKIRLAATQSKTSTVQEPIYGGQWNTLVVSSATPWANFSGCTSGNLRRSKIKTTN